MAVDDVKRDSMCEVHPANKVVLYCKTCEQLICTKCVSHGGTARHTDHIYLDLVEAYDIGKEELEKMLGGFKDDLNQKRAERQELHTKLQKLQLSLLRKKTELGKSCRALQDCLCKREKSFMGEVDGIVQPAIAQCEQRHKDVEYDVVSRDGLLSAAEAIQQLPASRVLTYLKRLGGIKKELQQIRRRTFTEYEEDTFGINRLDSIHLDLTPEKHVIDRAFSFPSEAPSAPRILSSWCVIGEDKATLVWKYDKKNAVKQFHVYMRPLTSYYSDRKYIEQCSIKTKTVTIKEKIQEKRKRVRKQNKEHKKNDMGSPVKLENARLVNNNLSKQYAVSKNETTEQSSGWWQTLSPWKRSKSEGTSHNCEFGEKESDVKLYKSQEESPSWFVVEPVSAVESLSGQEQEIQDNLAKSMAHTEALRQRYMGLRKKSSVSDQYLYSSVFRPKSESTSLFGSKERLKKQESIKEQGSKETVNAHDEKDKNMKSSESKDLSITTPTERYIEKKLEHRYTAIDSTMLDSDDFQKIKICKFVPGRVQVILRNLKVGQKYMACITAVNQCGTSEAVVMHFQTSTMHSSSSLQTLCFKPNKKQICYNALNYTFRILVLMFGLALYGFLVFYLFSTTVQYGTCENLIDSMKEVTDDYALDNYVTHDSIRTLCQQTDSSSGVQTIQSNFESWMKQLKEYVSDYMPKD